MKQSQPGLQGLIRLPNPIVLRAQGDVHDEVLTKQQRLTERCGRLAIFNAAVGGGSGRSPPMRKSLRTLGAFGATARNSRTGT